MKKKLLLLLVPLALLVAPAAAAAAAPAVNNGVPYGPTFPCFPGTASEFSFQTFIVADKTKPTPTKVTGQYVASFENLTTGKIIVRNVSGPTVINPPDGVFEATGNNFLLFGRVSQSTATVPGLLFTSGEVAVTYSGHIAQSVSLNGTSENGCDLLR